jgi:hypothetical protein
MMEAQEQDEEYGNETQQAVEAPSRPSSRDEQDSPTKNGNFDMTNNVGFNNPNNVDFPQMMQMMAQNGGMGFNPMMGTPHLSSIGHQLDG